MPDLTRQIRHARTDTSGPAVPLTCQIQGWFTGFRGFYLDLRVLPGFTGFTGFTYPPGWIWGTGGPGGVRVRGGMGCGTGTG